MSNIKNILAENDDLVQSNGSLLHTNLKLQVEAAMYASVIAKAINSLRDGLDRGLVIDDLEESLTAEYQKRIKKVEPAA